jgi:CheY-like chemotaxis protein
MPKDIDGIELMQSIRAGETEMGQSGTSRNVMIILFTAWSDDEFKERIIDAHFDLILGKPLYPDMLIDYLVMALRKEI